MRIRTGGQDGFVSLLAAILISLLLVIITVSMVTLEALQLRTAEDAEQSMRAYYTAEAGTEDAVAKILSGAISTTSDQLCPSVASTGAPYGGAGSATNWTCQQITFSGQPMGDLKADQAATVNPGNGPNFQSVEIEWNQSTDAVASDFDMNLGAGFPTAAAFVADHYAAPPIELQIVQYPSGGFSENDVCSAAPTSCAPGGLNSPKEAFLQNALITPGGSGAGTGTVDYTTLFQNPARQLGNCAPAPRNGTGWAGATTDYNCYVILENLPPARDFLFRIRSRYADSSYKFTFWSNPNGGGNQVSVPAGMATIDVTAQAGQVYRRVISDFPINSSAASGLNYVMFSDTNVCKNFDVIDDNPPPAICP